MISLNLKWDKVSRDEMYQSIEWKGKVSRKSKDFDAIETIQKF